jgi:hypothetical protein
MGASPTAIRHRIRSDCGRARYRELAPRQGSLAPIRLLGFVLAAALRELSLPPRP